MALTLPKILPAINTDDISKEFQKRAPDIAIGIGIGGLILAGILAVAVTPKADKKLSRAEVKKGDKLTPVEVVQTVGKDYILPTGLAIASATSIILGTKELHKRTAAIMALCTIAETQLSDYKEKVVELIGKEKEETVQEAVDKKTAERIEASTNLPQANPNGQLQPFMDLYSKKAFASSEIEIERVVNHLNRRINEHHPVSLNDFYYELESVSETYGGELTVSFGEDVGWSEYTNPIEIRYGAYRDKNGTARSTIDFKYPPKPNF